ncbi:hypothetical protein KI688_003160 [Linnemannia hyalina]|uniref:Uncharacterized protein n=1 Tax=Linnemannia hyalina TaxID=64524 RepID=A0A9P8BR54_9FUNG|nr:hypothetical protein KI688_003160 [Linnemannia hyalina]
MGDFLELQYKYGSRRGDSTIRPFYYPESSSSGSSTETVHETRLKAYLPILATYLSCEKYLGLIGAYPAIVKTSREGGNSGDLRDSESEIENDHN